MFTSVLVANRGEIAVRIIRTLRAMGIRAVTVASIPDRHSLAVRAADEWVLLEGYSAAETYLDAAAIIRAARDTGCQAIHPGYGFLSERPDFAEACAATGIAFIGPPPAVLRAVGDKAAARQLAISCGVPVVPGWDGEDSDAILLREAGRIGFPVMIKARGGGGGRGMRAVHDPGEMPDALESARREALAAFGDPGLLLERLVTGAHHVEVQVVADSHGNAVHLGERDCSVQRRHQKLVEESPSPVVDDALREALTTAALKLARAVGYVNAGTFEFLVGQLGSPGAPRPFYFLEVNPRLQVEHPVTEMVTGLDLVELQLRVAAGEPLPVTQSEVTFSGHAIEFRINAEDPRSGFKPGHGRITGWEAPPASVHVRLDSGYGVRTEVPAAYDSLVAKLIVHGDSRSAAIAEARRALTGLRVDGITTSLGLHLAVLGTAAFPRGEATVDWLEGALDTMRPPAPPDDHTAAAAAAAVLGFAVPGDPRTPWRRPAEASFWMDGGFGPSEVATRRIRPGEVCVDSGGESWLIRDTGPAAPGAQERVFLVGASATPVLVRPSGPGEWEACDRAAGTVSRFRIVPPPPLPRRAHTAAEGVTDIFAPLAGTIASVRIAEGDAVEAGQLLAVLEAMKMEHRITAPAAGVVRVVRVRERDVVREGDLLVELA